MARQNAPLNNVASSISVYYEKEIEPETLADLLEVFSKTYYHKQEMVPMVIANILEDRLRSSYGVDEPFFNKRSIASQTTFRQSSKNVDSNVA